MHNVRAYLFILDGATHGAAYGRPKRRPI